MADAVWMVDNLQSPAAVAAAALGISAATQSPDHGFYLQATAAGLTLYRADASARDAGLRIELDAAARRRSAGGRTTPLARACGLHRRAAMSVLDATCGLGRDSATLAELGCTVTALERHPVLFALLADARTRAQQSASPPAWLAQWPALHHANAADWLAVQPRDRFDIIYIDPMFVSTRRKARPQKALAWLGALVGNDLDAPELLAVARARALRRVTVKQHSRAAPLVPPDLQVRAKAVRFDIYLTPAAAP